MNDVSERPVGYFERTRSALIDEIPLGASRVLEVGCAGGATLRAIKARNPQCRVSGTDAFVDAAGLDEFVRADFETTDLPFGPGTFDVVICADVLEHLRDPWVAARRCADWLRPGGRLVVSLPNFCEFKNIWRVTFLRDFRYTTAGILDVGHYRFFCRRNAVELVAGAGLRVERVRLLGGRSRHVLNRLTCGALFDWLAYQVLIVGTKPS